MPPVVVFEVTDQLRRAIEKPEFSSHGRIPLDAYPFRSLKRGTPYVALFVDQSAGPHAVVIHAVGRVVPGDRSGESNRNLTFDCCYRLDTPLAVRAPGAFESDLWNKDVIRAVDRRTPLPPHAGADLLSLVASVGPEAKQAVTALIERLKPRVIEGDAGFVLACERDAAVLALKAANLHQEISTLSDWQTGPPDTPFIAGLPFADTQAQRASRNDPAVLALIEEELDARAGRVHVSRTVGYGPIVDLINLRPAGSGTPDGVDLVYFHPRNGVLALLRYTASATWPASYQQVIDSGIGYAGAEILDPLFALDESLAGAANPNDPRMVATACFVKFSGRTVFDPDATPLIPGNIHVAADLRAAAPRPDDPFASDRHLNNSTFAALLGAGWLGVRAAHSEDVYSVARVLTEQNRALVIVVQDWPRR